MNPLFEDAQSRTTELSKDPKKRWHPSTRLDDIYITMLQTAENVAQYEGVTRQEQDEFAAESQQRAETAQKAGVFDREITPVTTPSGRIVSQDDSPRWGTTIEKLANLKPILTDQMGDKASITAGNACPLNDGAAAIIVMSETRAKDLNIQPLARNRVHRHFSHQPRNHGPWTYRSQPTSTTPSRAFGPRHRPHRTQRSVCSPGDSINARTRNPT